MCSIYFAYWFDFSSLCSSFLFAFFNVLQNYIGQSLVEKCRLHRQLITFKYTRKNAQAVTDTRIKLQLVCWQVNNRMCSHAWSQLLRQVRKKLFVPDLSTNGNKQCEQTVFWQIVRSHSRMDSKNCLKLFILSPKIQTTIVKSDCKIDSKFATHEKFIFWHKL
jgi:hypothetical protein